MLQFPICYHSHFIEMLHRKQKLTYILGAKPGSDHPAKCWVKGFIFLHKYHDPNFYRRFRHTLAKLTKILLAII